MLVDSLILPPTLGTASVTNPNKFVLELYFCGCSFRCKNCHNQELWDYKKEYEIDVYSAFKYLREYINNPLIGEIQILGGEPLWDKNRILFLTELLKLIKSENKNINIVLFTGYNLKDLDLTAGCFKYVDYLKCGRYIENLPSKQLNPSFVLASSNQEIYKLPELKKII